MSTSPSADARGLFRDSLPNRKWTRIPPAIGAVKARLEIDGTTSRGALVMDDSVEGIAVQLYDASRLEAGQLLMVTYRGVTRGAVVRCLARQGIFHRVGLEWAEKPPAAKRTAPPVEACSECPSYSLRN